MPTKEQIPVTLQESEQHSDGLLYLSRFSKNERLKRAFIAMLLCWLAGAVAVFIPILHFFLVPLLLIIGPILFYFKSKQQDAKEKVDGVCPSTQQVITLNLEANTKMPLWTYCPNCKKSLQIKYHD